MVPFVAEAPTADETITITPNEDGTVNINFASLTLAAPEKPVNDFIVENVVVTENEDGSVSYSLEGACPVCLCHFNNIAVA